jgi:hypothetical protein
MAAPLIQRTGQQILACNIYFAAILGNRHSFPHQPELPQMQSPFSNSSIKCSTLFIVWDGFDSGAMRLSHRTQPTGQNIAHPTFLENPGCQFELCPDGVVLTLPGAFQKFCTRPAKQKAIIN